MTTATYVVDGIYVDDDGHQLWLAVNHHANRVIAIELEYLSLVIEALKIRAEQMQARSTPVFEEPYLAPVSSSPIFVVGYAGPIPSTLKSEPYGEELFRWQIPGDARMGDLILGGFKIPSEALSAWHNKVMPLSYLRIIKDGVPHVQYTCDKQVGSGDEITLEGVSLF